MNSTDLCLGDQIFSQSRIHNCKEYNCHNTENHSTDYIEQQMHQCCCLCISLCSNTGKHRCHTCTDVLSHNDINCCTHRNKSCCCKTLKDSDRCRRTLDHSCHNCSCKNSKEWILSKCHKNITKCF